MQTQPASHDEKDVDDDDDDENDDDDDTSESSIECTIEITPSTPTTPTSSSHPVRRRRASKRTKSVDVRPRRRKARRRYPRSLEGEGEVDGVVLLSARYSDFDSNDWEEARSSELEVSEEEDEIRLTFEDREGASTPLEAFRLSSESLELEALNREIDISLVPSVSELLGNEASTDRDVDASSLGAEPKAEVESDPEDEADEDEETPFPPDRKGNGAEASEGQSHATNKSSEVPSLTEVEHLVNADFVATDRGSDYEQDTKL